MYILIYISFYIEDSRINNDEKKKRIDKRVNIAVEDIYYRRENDDAHSSFDNWEVYLEYFRAYFLPESIDYSAIPSADDESNSEDDDGSDDDNRPPPNFVPTSYFLKVNIVHILMCIISNVICYFFLYI